MINSNTFGIDLGTSNIKIYSYADDTILVEKNIIAIEGKKNIFAYGDSAYEMYEKAPSNITISFPLSNGVIADIKNMETLVHFFVNDLCRNNIKPSDYYITVPTDVTEVEKRAFYDLVKEADVKARHIWVVEKAIADGLGMNIDVKNAQGVLVVDVGYDTTEISILSLGGIVRSSLIKVGGYKFDEAIISATRKQFNLVIGQKTAESVKNSLKELEEKGQDAVVFGRDLVSGLPVERALPTKTVCEAMSDQFRTIIDAVKLILELTPPELSADIYKHGIYLTGGASQTSHLSSLLSKSTGLKINESEYPVTSVALGLATIMKDDNFKSVAYSIEGK